MDVQENRSVWEYNKDEKNRTEKGYGRPLAVELLHLPRKLTSAPIRNQPMSVGSEMK